MQALGVLVPTTILRLPTFLFYSPGLLIVVMTHASLAHGWNT